MITPRPALAFLQNMWVTDPSEVKASIARMEATHGKEVAEGLRLRFIARSLFAGCKTGRVLKGIFGDMVDQIRWEESTREISNNSRETFPPDMVHIRAAIARHQPKVVIAFGGIAVDAVRPLCLESPAWSLIEAPHPAAIGHEIVERLKLSAEKLKTILSN